MKRLVVGPLEVNCFILWDHGTLEAFVIDPGGDGGLIREAVDREGLEVRYILNTHGHFDHIGADRELKDAFHGAELAIHERDVPLAEKAEEQASRFGLTSSPQPGPDILLEDGMVLRAGVLSLEVIHTPGHTEGGVCLFERREGLLFTGDTLFAGSVGRTDLLGGSFDLLLDSIKKKILPLGDHVRVFPGHGPETTIAEEKELNPFVRDY